MAINVRCTVWRWASRYYAPELGRNPVSKHQIQPEYADEQADAGRDCRTRLCETKFSGANAGDREIFIFPVQLATCMTGNLAYLVDLYSCYMRDHMCDYT